MAGSNIGRIVKIATGVPATFDKAGYEALAWVQIKGVTSIGAGGTTHAKIDIPDLETGFTKVVKGAESGTERSIPWRDVPSDAGQDAAEAASNTALGEFSIAVFSQDLANVEYASGVVTGYQTNEQSTDSYDGASVNFTQNYRSVNVTAPA